MKRTIRIIAAVAAVVVLAGLVWQWGFCRFYVQPGKMAILTAKTGAPLPPGQILAREGQKGIQEVVLGEGRHFRNPITFDREIRPLIEIPPGKVGVVTSKVGADLPEGEFLAAPGQKGIWRRALGPGKYRLNPYGYQVDVVDAISIPIGYAGVLTSLSGRQAEPGAFAGPDEKGIRRDILQPGLYYVNPKEFKVDLLEIGVNQVSLLGGVGGKVITKRQLETANAPMAELQQNVLDEQKRKRSEYLSRSAQSMMLARPAAASAQPGRRLRGPAEAERDQVRQMSDELLLGDSMATMGIAEFVEFPSRDGFRISLDMTVEFELLPENIAGIFSVYGDMPALVSKIILPQITSIARNKGSEYGAKDFIAGEGREKFQEDLTQALAETLKTKSILIHNALIRHVEVPDQILQPIQQASIAIQQDLTNKEKQNTARKLAELNTEQSLIEQRREQVAQETRKMKAEIKADQEKQVAEIKAEALRQVADITRETAAIRADTVRTLSTAEAEAVKLVDGEKALGLQMKAAAFDDPSSYSLWILAQNLNPDLRVNILHAGDGTLWTDIDPAHWSALGGAAVLEKK